MDNIVQEKIKFKIEDIVKLFEEYELIFEKIRLVNPDLFDMTIVGSVLHSFYNGIENIFEIIAKDIDRSVPTGTKSHQELLKQMTIKSGLRNAVIDEELYLKLKEYATFRHFYRYAYSFQLKWDKMEPLVRELHNIWKHTKECFETFIKNN